MFKRFFKKKELSEEEIQRLEEEWYDVKSKRMENILGREHDMVMHALIPYEVGGALDLYYYPSGIPGTAIATKELAFAYSKSSQNDKFEKYELAMFTREELDLDKANETDCGFGIAHQNISAILNSIARYSEAAKLNPNETCEFPSEMENIGGKCLIFSAYNTRKSDREEFGVMAVVEIFRSEMEFARENGGGRLIQLLKDNGCYPYSDLTREPVI